MTWSKLVVAITYKWICQNIFNQRKNSLQHFHCSIVCFSVFSHRLASKAEGVIKDILCQRLEWALRGNEAGLMLDREAREAGLVIVFTFENQYSLLLLIYLIYILPCRFWNDVVTHDLRTAARSRWHKENSRSFRSYWGRGLNISFWNSMHVRRALKFKFHIIWIYFVAF